MSKIKWLIFSIFFLMFMVGQTEANIILKVISVNPSREQTQKVPVKAYLPKEVKPEDIVDKADLEIVYDTQQGSYFVYGDYELKPGEILEKEIEIKDIWVIPTVEIESLRLEMDKTAKLLENTDFRERVNFLKQSIEQKLKEITEKQSVPPANPERHISDYRDNLRLLESVKADLVVARSLLAQARPMSSVAIWRLFLAIVIFLGVLGLSFYLIWQRQLKVITTSASAPEPKTEAQPAAMPQGERREVKEEKKVEADDIEKIIKEGEEP